ncbi:peptidase domain-containing ABC transporter [Gracilibacillus suaedae]|uniref:peptidase domain-containing ABC transporter n=1 Tax=Gracilibacillus suaedae TaxID=2820273 RepID=UPI001ABE2893|nr:peptidase domain-containing ABC transporter [Gracilibacillus suaedae]
MKRVPYIQQMQESECGLACITMILHYHQHHISLSDMRNHFKVSRDGLSFKDLVNIASYYDLNTKSYQCPTVQLHKMKLPCLIHFDNNHYVVLNKVTKRKAYIVDPNNGKAKIPLEEFQNRYSGYLIEFTPTKNFKKMKAQGNFRSFVEIIIQNKNLIMFICLSSLLLQIFGIITPITIGWITDNVIVPEDTEILPTILYIILSLFLFYEIFSILRSFLIAKMQTLFDESLMKRFVSHLLKLPYSFFEERSVGDLVFNSNSHIIIRQILSNRSITLMIDIILLFTYATFMLIQSVVMGMLVISLGIMIFLSVLISRTVTKRLTDRDVNAQAKTQSFLAEFLHGMTDVKTLSVEGQVYEGWWKKFSHQIQITQKRTFWTSSLDSFANGILVLAPALLIAVGAYYVINGQISLGTLLAFNALSAAFLAPISSLGQTYNDWLLINSYIQKINDVMLTKTEEDQQTKGITNILKTDPPRLQGQIELHHVSFQYDDFSDPILKDIHLKISPGEKIGIVGSSGSGKSTLAKLFLGLYTPSEGQVLYDGISLQRLNLPSLRKQIGTILQETTLFNKSVLENIRMENKNISNEQVKLAAELAYIHDEIISFPMGYHTILTEGGENFSGGQRQRLLIARAIAQQPSILIMDEATSSLDYQSEAIISENLQSLNITQIIIAHRLSTIKEVDCIYVMDKGEIVEKGTHEELLNKNGHYSALYRGQKQNIKEELIGN